MASYYLRALDGQDMADLRARARACLEGAATATGTTVTVEQVGNAYEPIEQNAGLVEAFDAACRTIGRPFTPDPQGDDGLSGSTDFGNISQLVPAIHADLAVHSWPAVNHQHEFAAHSITPAADRTLLEGAAAMALVALSVAADPSLLTR